MKNYTSSLVFKWLHIQKLEEVFQFDWEQEWDTACTCAPVLFVYFQ
jgi:hypothetical protein